MLFLVAALAVSALSALLVGAKPDKTITLYAVNAPPLTSLPAGVPSISGGYSISYSPIGVGPDGRTTYDEIVALTAGRVEYASSTETLTIPPPSPTTITLVEGSDGLEEAYTDIVFRSRSCALHGTSQGECVLVEQVTGSSSRTLEVTTWTGIPTPIYTLVESSGTRIRWRSSHWIVVAVGLVVAVIV
ncbi:hypothetical protein AN958_11629 [Leucoagaricus sp. SymC.cos]|nr:hypothetical protein AN958_11629 [Leucoagaricus sp. SymC.cos]